MLSLLEPSARSMGSTCSLCPLPGLGETAGLFTLLLQGAAGMGLCSFIGVVLKLFAWGGGGRK